MEKKEFNLHDDHDSFLHQWCWTGKRRRTFLSDIEKGQIPSVNDLILIDLFASECLVFICSMWNRRHSMINYSNIRETFPPRWGRMIIDRHQFLFCLLHLQLSLQRRTWWSSVVLTCAVSSVVWSHSSQSLVQPICGCKSNVLKSEHSAGRSPWNRRFRKTPPSYYTAGNDVCMGDHKVRFQTDRSSLIASDHSSL